MKDKNLNVPDTMLIAEGLEIAFSYINLYILKLLY